MLPKHDESIATHSGYAYQATRVESESIGYLVRKRERLQYYASVEQSNWMARRNWRQ